MAAAAAAALAALIVLSLACSSELCRAWGAPDSSMSSQIAARAFRPPPTNYTTAWLRLLGVIIDARAVRPSFCMGTFAAALAAAEPPRWHHAQLADRWAPAPQNCYAVIAQCYACPILSTLSEPQHTVPATVAAARAGTSAGRAAVGPAARRKAANSQ